jgi:hypothetical protein
LQAVIGDRVQVAARAEGVIPRGGRLRLRMKGGTERVVDVAPNAREPDRFEFEFENIQAPFTYQFILNDGAGEVFDVVATPPPRVAKLTVRITEPAYTKRPPEEQSDPPFRLLAGSEVEIRGTASEPLATAAIQLTSDTPPIPLTVSGADFQGRWVVPLQGFDGFTIPLVNEQGVPSQPDRLYAVRYQIDQPPVIEVIQPEIIPETMVEATPLDIVVQVRDDFDLGPATLHFRIEPENGEELQGKLVLPMTNPTEPIAVRWNPTASSPAPKVGDRVSAWVEIHDAVGQSARTPEWSFRVVTKEEKRAELTEKLRAQSLEIQRLREAQEAAQEELRRTIEKPLPEP